MEPLRHRGSLRHAQLIPGLPVGAVRHPHRARLMASADYIDDRHRRRRRPRGAAAPVASNRAGGRADRQCSCSRSSRAMSIRSRPRWSRSACSRPAHTDNVIPQTALLRGTARSLDAASARSAREARARGGRRHRAALRRQGQAHLPARLSGAREPRAADRVRGLGRRARSSARTRSTTDMAPVMGAEDFSYMLEARPGAFIFVGNGDSAGLHHPAYNFNDEVDPGRDVLLGAAGRDRAARRRLARAGSYSRTLRSASTRLSSRQLRLARPIATRSSARAATGRPSLGLERRARRRSRLNRVPSISGQHDRRQERQALHHQHERENIDLAHLLVVGRSPASAHRSAAAPAMTPSQNAGKSGPLRDVPPLAVRMNGRCSLMQAVCRPRAPPSIAPTWRRTRRRASGRPDRAPAADRAQRNARTRPRRRRGSATVRIVSGTAMSAKATTGTQTIFRMRNHDADASRRRAS